MKVVTITAAFLHLCLHVTVTVSGEFSSETAFTAAPGDTALLPCSSDGNITPSFTRWTKNGREIISRNHSAADSPGQRLTILDNGSLAIQEVIRGDEGTYLCNATVHNNTFHSTVELQVVSGPETVFTSISPVTPLLNGTFTTSKGSNVSFNCSSSSYPSQQLSWDFTGASPSNGSLVSGVGSWLDFRIEDIQPSAQGEYTCTAHNPVSHQAANRSTQLLVYYAPERHPECLWQPADDPSHVQFSCSWFGAYPTPTLTWGEAQDRHGISEITHVYGFNVTDHLEVMMNRSQLFDGQMMKCKAEHPVLGPEGEKSCSLTLKLPFPEGEPLVTALEGTNVTLICTEISSAPPANTTWKKGLKQVDIVPGSKYILEAGPTMRLTIVNVSKDDEGVYFCRSENPLAVRELEVYLTVKTSSAYTGAIIGVFIAALIVGSAVIIAKLVFSSRHRICLGSGFGRMDEDRGDVLSLVDSDDEQIFQDTVPRLPPVTNGHHTTLVQIHRIPSSDHEDLETADTSPQQQEDTVQIEEPADLVTF